MDSREQLIEQMLVLRCQMGDKDAFAGLIEKYQRPLRYFISRLLDDAQTSEDILQETWLSVVKRIHGLKKTEAFSTWLYKIAFNHCIDAIRKKKLRTLPLDKPIQLQAGEVHHQIKDESHSPERVFLFAEKRTLIQKSIESLPERYRVAIILRHQEERSYEEISEILKIPLGTVKARIFRAREMLKKKLREE